MRVSALKEATRNIEYLEKSLASTTLVSMQQSIGRLLEAELQKSMLARGNEDFAFKVVDRAEAPKRRSRPNRLLLVELAFVFGGFIAAVFVLGRSAFVDRRRDP
jgi:uncharacterized protein involved in exopolysaccharide biosynthesis